MEKNKNIIFSLLCPTRGRNEGVVRLIRSICDSTYDFNTIELLFRIDNDDLTTREFLMALMRYFWQQEMIPEPQQHVRMLMLQKRENTKD